MAVQFDRLTVIYHALQFFFSQTDQYFSNPYFVAVTVETGRHFLIDFQIHITKQFFQQHFRCITLIQKFGNRSDLCQIFLQFLNHFFLCVRHQLHDKSTGLADSIILLHQYAKSYCGRHLLTACKIIGQIISDLTGL